MAQLIKPSEYAKKMGISRQAVYAKIKRGILTSKSVDGKLYVVEGSEKSSARRREKTPNASSNSPRHSTGEGGKDLRELLLAKDETIGILKETITDLKETNQMITSTLRSEVDLLKEAFSEMKMLYSTQIEHMRLEERSSFVQEELPASDVIIGAEGLEKFVEEEPGHASHEDKLAWIELSDFFDENGLNKKKKKNKITKRLEKLFKKGDSRVDSFNGELVVRADADYSDVLKKKKKH